MWLTVVPQFGVLLVSLAIVEPPRRHTSRRALGELLTASRLFWKNPLLRLTGAWSMTGYALGEAGFQFTPVFVSGLWPLWAIGVWSTMSHGGGFLGYRFSGRWVRPQREVRVMGVSKLVSAALTLPALVFPSGASPALMGLTSVAYGPSNVAEATLLQREFSDAQRATLGSINSLGGNLLFGAVAVGLGAVADRLAPATGLLVLQVLSLARLALLWPLRRKA
jgi:hypothetical protein